MGSVARTVLLAAKTAAAGAGTISRDDVSPVFG